MNPVWLQIIGLGVLLVLLGGWLLLVPLRAVRDTSPLVAAPGPCATLLTAWEKATSECEEARRDAEDARATAERRVAEVEAARELATRLEARATETCDRAAEAQLAYEACVKERASPQAASRSR